VKLSDRDQIKVLSRNLPGRTEQNKKKILTEIRAEHILNTNSRYTNLLSRCWWIFISSKQVVVTKAIKKKMNCGYRLNRPDPVWRLPPVS
jgi:hypothetical protein